MMIPPPVAFVQAAGQWYRVLMHLLVTVWQVVSFYVTRGGAFLIRVIVGPYNTKDIKKA
jgi:hypothetical protein